MLNVKVHENTSIVCVFEWLLGESLFPLKRAWQHNFGLQSCIWTNHQTSATMSFGYCPTCMRLLPRAWVSASIFQSIVQYPYTAVYLLSLFFCGLPQLLISLCICIHYTLPIIKSMQSIHISKKKVLIFSLCLLSLIFLVQPLFTRL